MQNIVPLYYDMKKAEPVQLNQNSLYEGMILAYTSGNIGPYSNNISKIWNCDTVGQKEIDVIKLLCAENNYVIDFAKTLYKPTRPSEIDEIIKNYTRLKLPSFFMYAKDKKKNQVASSNNSTMNRISNAVPTSKISYCHSIGKFNYKMLLNDCYYQINPDTYIIISTYDYWNKRQNSLYNHSDENYRNQEDLYVYQQIRQNILDIINKPINYIVDSLVAYLYTQRDISNKKLLWACFGQEIVNNLKKNTENLGKICANCGSRFDFKSNKEYCSSKCKMEYNNSLVRYKNC